MKSYYRHDYGANQRTYHRARRRRLLFAVLARGGAALALAGVAALAATAWSELGPAWLGERLAALGLLRIESVRVSGNQTLPAAELLAAAGLRTGGSLLTLDLQAARAQLVRHPRVRTAALRRRLPGSVEVEVEERVPCAVVRAGRDLLVDAEGAVLGAAGAPGGGLPVLAGVEVAGGALTARGAEDLAAGLELIAAIGRVGFPAFSAIERIDLSDPDDALIVPVSGRPLVHAGRGDFALRLARWRLVAPDMARRWPELEYVDLRAEGQVVALPAAEPAAAEDPGAAPAGGTGKPEAAEKPGRPAAREPAGRPKDAGAGRAGGGHA